MKKFIFLLLTLILITSCGNNTKIGKYTKEELPTDFTYRIIKDDSDKILEKNELSVELSKKLTEGQIATLAEKLYNSKDKERRFYIFYSLKDSKESSMSWAVSHFDPELEITINGSTKIQEANTKKSADEVDGTIIGKFYEEGYTSGSFTIFERNNKIFIKSTFKDGSSMENEMIESKVENGKKLEFSDGTQNGEYYILISDKLEFYNSENKKFAEAEKIE